MAVVQFIGAQKQATSEVSRLDKEGLGLSCASLRNAGVTDGATLSATIDPARCRPCGDSHAKPCLSSQGSSAIERLQPSRSFEWLLDMTHVQVL